MKNFLLLLLLAFTPNILFSCSCLNVPTNFFQAIHDDDVIFKAKVLKHHTFEGESWPAITITSLQVLKWYKNRLGRDTVYFQNGDGASCEGGIQRRREVGEVIILKTYRDTSSLEIFEWEDLGLDLYKDSPNYKKFLSSLDKDLLISASICHVWYLKVEGRQVQGNITKSTFHKRWKRKVLLEKVSPALAEKYYDKKMLNKNLDQSMIISRFERKARRKL